MRVGRIECVGGQFAQLVAAQLVGDEPRAVGSDPDVPLAGLVLPLPDVARELRFGVVPLAPQVALELEHRAPKERVDPAADLGDMRFELDVRAGHAEAIDQQLAYVGPNGLVARTRGELVNDLSKLLGGQPHHSAGVEPRGDGIRESRSLPPQVCREV